MNIFKKGQLSAADIHTWLVELRPHAYMPESLFAVTVVLRASLGGAYDYYFGGVNVEYSDHRLSTHGEEGAIAAMITALGKHARIVELWVMGAPQDVKSGDATPTAEAFVTCCGKCRQQIVALASGDAKIHYVSLNGKTMTTTVDAFLPDAFTLTHATPVSKQGVVTAMEAEKKLLRKGPLTQADVEAWLKSLEPVDVVSNVSQSIIVELDNGFYVAGTRVEDAAFLDISAAQSAMAIASGEFKNIKVINVWVYTKENVKSSPAGVTAVLPLSSQQVLKTFGKDAKLAPHYLSSLD